MRMASWSAPISSAMIRVTPSVESEICDLGSASVQHRCGGERSCSPSSQSCRSSRCGGTSTRGCASEASAGSTLLSSRPVGWTGSGSPPAFDTRFAPDELLPEAGQGALALQVRAGDEHLVAAADHSETRHRVEAERRCLAVVGGGCLAPVAAFHDGVTLTGLVAAEDGAWVRRAADEDPVALGRALASLAAAA